MFSCLCYYFLRAYHTIPYHIRLIVHAFVWEKKDDDDDDKSLHTLVVLKYCDTVAVHDMS